MIVIIMAMTRYDGLVVRYMYVKLLCMAVIFSLEINFDLRDGPFLARGLEGKAIKFITVITHVVVASQVLLIILQGLTRLILSCPPATAVFDMPLCKNVYVASVKMCM